MEHLNLIERAQFELARIAAATILMSAASNEEIRKIFLSGEDYETVLHSSLGELQRISDELNKLRGKP